MLRDYIKQKRVSVAKQYVEDSKRKLLLDIGCDDNSFIDQFEYLQTIGIDKNMGHYIERDLNFEDNKFDYITMLAVIEHLEYPVDVIKECYRVLKKGGLLIITSPFDNVLFDLIHNRLYTKEEFEDEGFHIQSFNKTSMNAITDSLFYLKEYKLFELGFNQVFVYEKKD